MLKRVFFTVLMGCLMVSLAQASVYEKRPDHDAFEEALNACMDEAGRDGQGRPDRETVDACMKKKGFEKPEGGPGGHGGPPPRD